MSEAKAPIYDDYEDVVRCHHEQNYDREKIPIGRVAIAYSHGFTMAVDEQEEHRDWVECEEGVWKARDEEGFGPWQDFRKGVRKGWETAKEALGEGLKDPQRRQGRHRERDGQPPGGGPLGRAVKIR